MAFKMKGWSPFTYETNPDGTPRKGGKTWEMNKTMTKGLIPKGIEGKQVTEEKPWDGIKVAPRKEALPGPKRELRMRKSKQYIPQTVLPKEEITPQTIKN